MAKVVICPSCQYQGSIPDEIQAKRIRCPKCKESFDVALATQSSGSRPRAGGPLRRSGLDRRTGPLTISTVFSHCLRSATRGRGGHPPGPDTRPAKSRPVDDGRRGPRSWWACGGLARRCRGADAQRGKRQARRRRRVDPPRLRRTDPPESAHVTRTGRCSIRRETGGACGRSHGELRRWRRPRRLRSTARKSFAGSRKRRFISSSSWVASRSHRHGFRDRVARGHDSDRDEPARVPAGHSEVPARFAKEATNPSLEVVIRSGLGTQTEQSLPAQLIATDSLSEDLNTDLAFLS